MLIVDSQVHTFGPQGGEVPALQAHRKLSESQLLVEMDGAGVKAAVLVPARPDPSATNALALEMAARTPDRFGVMGRLSLDEALEASAMRQWPDSGLLGYRVSFPPGQPGVSDPQNAWVWRTAESVGAPLMVWAPGQLEDLGHVASEHSQVRMVIDHLGLAVADKDDAVAAVASEIAKLSVLDNIAVKASGLPGHSTAPFPYENMHQPIREVVDAFGAERVFWGTDLTTLPCPYIDAVRMFTEAMDLDGSDLELVMGLGLLRWLNWTTPST